MRNRLTLFTKYFLDFIFAGGCILLVLLPILIKYLRDIYPKIGSYYYLVLFLFLGVGVICLLILWELRKMFQTVLTSNPFVRANQKSLKKMGYYSFTAALFLTPFIFLIFRAAYIVVVLVFIIAGLFSMVLSQLFGQAVTYKEENDLTI